jgi:hypothetical protein
MVCFKSKNGNPDPFFVTDFVTAIKVADRLPMGHRVMTHVEAPEFEVPKSTRTIEVVGDHCSLCCGVGFAKHGCTRTYCGECFAPPADMREVEVDGATFDANRIAKLLGIVGDNARFGVVEYNGAKVLFIGGDHARSWTMMMRRDGGHPIESFPLFRVGEAGGGQ